jgi:hypothetical protein
MSLEITMRRRKRRRKRKPLPELSVPQILDWADAHHARTGQWPNVNSGEVAENPNEKWRGLDMDLRRGFRGLDGGSSLARLLAEARGVRNGKGLPAFSVAQILAWADAHHARVGQWPTSRSGPIPEAPGETWLAVQTALVNGRRGLPGGSSLPGVLARHRGRRNHMELPPLSIPQILAWADAHRARTGAWPREDSGAVADAPGETWARVDAALEQGTRGLRAGSSLPQVLAAHRGVRNPGNLPRLGVAQILAWADAFHGRTGRWPTARSGPISGSQGETWLRVDTALREGLRGLPGGSSLPRLLRQYRNRPAGRAPTAPAAPRARGDSAVHHVARLMAQGSGPACRMGSDGHAQAQATTTVRTSAPAVPDSDPRLGRRPPRPHGAVAQLLVRPGPGRPAG